MKTISALSLALYLTLASQAQGIKENDVPLIVRNAFQEKYPGNQLRKWIQEESIYEAEFLTKGKKYKATFDNSGKWVETERKIRTILNSKAFTRLFLRS